MLKAMKESTSSKKNYVRWLILAALVICLLIYLNVPPVQRYIQRVIRVLESSNSRRVLTFIRSYGAYAMLVSFALMIFQSVIAPIPAFLITFANAALFGWWQGAILSWVSSMVGASLCFFIARGLGRDVVEKYAGHKALQKVEGYFRRHGRETILICRLLPFVPFDAVSYFAGLTPLPFTTFILATGLGQLPATLIYSYVGGMLTGGTHYFVTALLLILALALLVPILKSYYVRRQTNRKSS